MIRQKLKVISKVLESGTSCTEEKNWNKKRGALRREGRRISNEIMESGREESVICIKFHSVLKFET
jgi:hypothetical protein